VKKYGLVLVPIALGLTLALVWQSGLTTNPILYLRADAGSLLLLLGIGASIVSVLGVALWILARYRDRKLLLVYQREQADAHRRFLRRLDHEIKNPLTAIRAGLANLNGRSNDPVLSSIRGQVGRLARLSADLRKLADLETQSVEQEPIDLGQLLNELVALEQERPEAAACHLALTLFQTPWPLPSIAGDRDLLFIALHNLVDNAIKFSHSDSTIEIRAFEDGRSVAVEVADMGIGIGEDELPHLGEELYRGSTARSVEGSGLGLALVRAIVARHNGTMTIRSRAGQGTVVTLRFPVTH
jgi:signal transduction histidine kinase